MIPRARIHLLLAAAFAAVFAAGVAVGVAGSLFVHHRIMRRATREPGYLPGVLCARMRRAVDLDEAQAAQCRAELLQLRGEWLALHEEVRPRAEASLARSRDRLRAGLRPDQLAKFDALMARWSRMHDAIAPPFPRDEGPASAPR